MGKRGIRRHVASIVIVSLTRPCITTDALGAARYSIAACQTAGQVLVSVGISLGDGLGVAQLDLGRREGSGLLAEYSSYTQVVVVEESPQAASALLDIGGSRHKSSVDGLEPRLIIEPVRGVFNKFAVEVPPVDLEVEGGIDKGSG